MANVLKRERQLQVLHLLAEGSSIRATERITKVHRDTICRLVVRFGEKCREFLDEQMQGLNLGHLEFDEIWTFVQKKQARLTTDERQECADMGDIYLWTCVDQQTKLVPSFALGKRSADNARRFMNDVAGRLARPNPHASDAHGYAKSQYRPIVQISTDGFPAYPEAVDLAFGPYARYGVLIKQFRNARLEYTPSEMVGTDRRPIKGEIDPFTICTSHVERHNLTIRTFMKRFNRLTICFSKKLENLAAATAMFIAYYNYCWRTRLPNGGRYRATAAMNAKLTGHVWTFAELFEAVLGKKA